ncbi:MAG: cupin domain-containing protein [Oscillospiraceae bacterium]
MELNEETLRRVIAQVLGNMGETGGGFTKTVDPSGVIFIRTDTVRCERFQQDGVAVKDVVTLQEAPRMGCGIMELRETVFPWTLTYDEYDLVLEGILEIGVGGRVLTGHPGDILYIPKNTSIEFRTKTYARYAYFVYPADWQ